MFEIIWYSIHKQKGYVQIIGLNTLNYYAFTESLPFLIRTNAINNNTPLSLSIIHTHSSPISCLVLNADGQRLVTSSQKGIPMRVFGAITRMLFHELCRGVDRAEIYLIAFNLCVTQPCVSFDKGAIHIFNRSSATAQQQSSLSFVKKKVLQKYFEVLPMLH